MMRGARPVRGFLVICSILSLHQCQIAEALGGVPPPVTPAGSPSQTPERSDAGGLPVPTVVGAGNAAGNVSHDAAIGNYPIDAAPTSPGALFQRSQQQTQRVGAMSNPTQGPGAMSNPPPVNVGSHGSVSVPHGMHLTEQNALELVNQLLPHVAHLGIRPGMQIQVNSSSYLLLSSLELSDTTIYEPQIRALLGTASHFCQVVVLKLRTVPLGPGQHWAAWSRRSFISSPLWTPLVYGPTS